MNENKEDKLKLTEGEADELCSHLRAMSRIKNLHESGVIDVKQMGRVIQIGHTVAHGLSLLSPDQLSKAGLDKEVEKALEKVQIAFSAFDSLVKKTFKAAISDGAKEGDEEGQASYSRTYHKGSEELVERDG